VGVQHLPPLVLAHVQKARPAADAGVVDQNVHPPVRSGGTVDHRRHGFLVADVGGNHLAANAEFLAEAGVL
jgi:hypothetical protein